MSMVPSPKEQGAGPISKNMIRILYTRAKMSGPCSFYDRVRTQFFCRVFVLKNHSQMLLAGYSHKCTFEYNKRNMNVVLLLDSCTTNFKVSGTLSQP